MSSELRRTWNVSVMAYFKIPDVFICGLTTLPVDQAV